MPGRNLIGLNRDISKLLTTVFLLCAMHDPFLRIIYSFFAASQKNRAGVKSAQTPLCSHS
jgi:hypothetical protein